MKMTKNTILITGGTSGIGLALAQKFQELGNRVIVTSRHPEVIAQTLAENPGLIGYEVDVTSLDSVRQLFKKVTRAYPELNMVIHSAGMMRGVDFFDPDADLTNEIETNLLGTIYVDKLFLPWLAQQKSAALVNISSGLSYLASNAHPIYSASKAGVNALTEALRGQARFWGYKNLHVIQVAPPLISETNLNPTMHEAGDRNPMNMSLTAFTAAVIKGIAKEKAIINPGPSKLLYVLSRILPQSLCSKLTDNTLKTEFPEKAAAVKKDNAR